MQPADDLAVLINQPSVISEQTCWHATATAALHISKLGQGCASDVGHGLNLAACWPL
jgi:hypothetical protein